MKRGESKYDILTDQIVKPQNDENKYKYIRLKKNKLDIFFVQNMNQGKSSAAINVNVGSLQDSLHRQGLAHLLEHMLLQGSVKYPNEDFGQFLKKNQGNYNSSTDYLQTSYYFDCHHSIFREGLNRFAQFFINPLFNQDLIDKEINVIDLKHQNNLLDDKSRKEYLLAMSSIKNSPFNKFRNGNINTLQSKSNRNDLIDFFKENYSSNLMKICIFTHENFEDIESYIVDLFEQIPNLYKPIPRYNEKPFPNKIFQSLWKYVPVKDNHSMRLMWTSEFFTKNSYQNHPLQYWAYIFGFQGQNSLFSALKHLGFAQGIVSGFDDIMNNSSIFYIDIDLTLNGIKNYLQVLNMVFTYLQILKLQGAQGYIYEECRIIGQQEFNNTEQIDSIIQAQQFAKNMQIYLPKDIISGMRYFKQYDPQLINQTIQSFSHENMRIFLSSQTFESECKLVDPYYFSKYSQTSIPQNIIDLFLNPTYNYTKCNGKQIGQPPANKFIEKDTILLPLIQNNLEQQPQIIKSDTKSEVFFQQIKLKVARVSAKLIIYSNDGNIQDSSENYVLYQVWMMLFQEKNREFIYQAQMAMIETKFKFRRSIEIEIEGFSQTIHKYMKELFERLNSFNPFNMKQEYELQYQNLIKKYLNQLLQKPHKQGKLYTSYHKDIHNVEELLKASKNINFEKLYKFHTIFLKNIFLTWYFNGNLTKQNALDITNQIETILFYNRSPLQKNDILIGKQQQLNNTRRVLELSEDEKQIFFQSIEEFQKWIKEFLKDSGFLDFVAELRQRMGINIDDIMCVESARDSDSQSLSSLFQVPVENLKEYIKQMMEFNKYINLTSGQYDIDLKNKNEQLNSQVYQLKEQAIKKQLEMVDFKNSLINELKANSEINIDEKDQIIEKLKSQIDQYILENSLHLNSIQQMEEEQQKKEEAICNLHEKITNLINENKKIRSRLNNNDQEIKEINENFINIQRSKEDYIKKLEIEIDDQIKQNIKLQEALDAEQKKQFMQQDILIQEQKQTFQQTLNQKIQIIQELENQLSSEGKYIDELYNNLQLEREQQGELPFNNLNKYIQNLIKVTQCEKNSKENKIEEFQLNESILKEKNNKTNENKTQYAIPSYNTKSVNEKAILNSFSFQIKNNAISVNKLMSKENLMLYITQQNQLEKNWINIQKQNQEYKRDNDQVFQQVLESKDLSNKKQNIKINNQKNLAKQKQQVNNGQSSHNQLTSTQIQKQQSDEEGSQYEQYASDLINQLICENKILSQALMIKFEDIDKVQTDLRLSNQNQYKLKQEMQNEFNNLLQQSIQNQNKLNQQLSEFMSINQLNQNLELEINNLKEENSDLKKEVNNLKERDNKLKMENNKENVKCVQNDNKQIMKELEKQKDISCQCYKNKLFCSLKNIPNENEKLHVKINYTQDYIQSPEKMSQINKELQMSQQSPILSSQLSDSISSNYHYSFDENQFNSDQISLCCQQNDINSNIINHFDNQLAQQNSNPLQTVSPAHRCIIYKKKPQNDKKIKEDVQNDILKQKNQNNQFDSRRILNLEKKQINEVHNQEIEDESNIYLRQTIKQQQDICQDLDIDSKAAEYIYNQSQFQQNNQTRNIKDNQYDKLISITDFLEFKENQKNKINFNLPDKNNNQFIQKSNEQSLSDHIYFDINQNEDERIQQQNSQLLELMQKYSTSSNKQKEQNPLQLYNRQYSNESQQQSNKKQQKAELHLNNQKRQFSQEFEQENRQLLNLSQYKFNSQQSFQNLSNQQYQEQFAPNKKRSFMKLFNSNERDEQLPSINSIRNLYSFQDKYEQDLSSMKENIYKQRFNENKKQNQP